MKKHIYISILAIMTLVALTGCTGNDLLPSGTTTSQGNVILSIVDAPDDAYEEVHINILKVFIKNAENKEWVQLGDYETSPYGVNLLDYRIQELVLNTEEVPAGFYEEIRIVLDKEGYVTLTADPTVQYPLLVGEYELDSDHNEDDEGSESSFGPLDNDGEDHDGEKAVLGDDEQAIDVEYPFYVTEDAAIALQIDFDVAAMVEPNNTTPEQDYILNPEEVSAMDKAEASEVKGKVVAKSTTTGEYIMLRNQLVTVKLYDVADLTTPITTTWATWKEMEDDEKEDQKAEPGKFKIRGIPAGEYEIHIETEGYLTAKILGLAFTDGEDLEIGDEHDGESGGHDSEQGDGDDGGDADEEIEVASFTLASEDGQNITFTLENATLEGEYIVLVPETSVQ